MGTARPSGGSPARESKPFPKQSEVGELIRKATAGEFEILGELGRGGMATVFLARDVVLGRKVAIKVMSPMLVFGDGMVERFKREARTAAQLNHPNIIPIHAVREKNDLVYFVMKFVEGRSLDSIIKEMGRMPIPMVNAILSQVGVALHHAHRHGVIHRDIKPANIMIDEDGYAVVTDFGVAKVEDVEGLTRTGSAVGTPFYMSPEQCAGEKLTGVSDQYSLGLVGYEMLTGTPPFEAGGIMQIMKAHLYDVPQAVEAIRTDCPRGLANVVMRMLEKEPADRWTSLEEAIRAIGAAPAEQEELLRTQMAELGRSGQRKLPRISTGPQRAVPAAVAPPAPATPAGQARKSEAIRRSEQRLPTRTPTPNRSKPVVRPPEAPTPRAVVGVSLAALVGLVAVGWLAFRPASARPPAGDGGVTVILTVSSDVPGATLSVNEKVIGPLAAGQSVALRPGQHRIRVGAPNCTPWERMVQASRDTLRLGKVALVCRVR
jgi:serine/threonine protein kinase